MRCRLLLPFLLAASIASAQTVTSPKGFLGHDLGEDYWLPNYQQFTDYWRKLDAESDRMTLQVIGKTAEGRDQLMAIVTSPENQKKLEHYKQIARKLALAQGISEGEAKALAAEGKAVVWIDGGLHATEVLGATQLMEMVYQFVSMNDPETLRILDDVIILFVHANPDGMELVSNWYMRNADPKKREFFTIPRLYQKYIGHDNNRDFYASTQPETKNMNRIMYREWFPQIMYNHHQTGPEGTVLAMPPYRDPFNYNFDPLLVTGLDLVGSAMQNRLASEGKGGFTSKTGASFSTWWNGGLRTTAYFHNIIGLLTETIGSPTPSRIPLTPDRLEPKGELPYPVEPQEWHFRQSVEYSVTANRAVLDLASRHREQFLFNIWRMGQNSIERGSRDSWTFTPKRVAAVGAAVKAKDKDPLQKLKAPEFRDPRGYIIPFDPISAPTATKFVNALIETGVIVHRATANFRLNGKDYPAGSYVIKTAQAFRPHILDMFEPQDHPNDFRAPGGPPTPPYDNAGWTLAYQMGIRFDRLLEPFDAPLETMVDVLKPPPGQVAQVQGQTGYGFRPELNESFLAANRLLQAGEKVFRSNLNGLFYVQAGPGTSARVNELAKELGVSFGGIKLTEAEKVMVPLRQPKIGLWDRYGGSMESGWTRWIFEQYGFPYKLVFPNELDAGNLKANYDVLVFVDGGIPERFTPDRRSIQEDTIPAEYRHMLGRVSAATIPKLKEFLEAGGKIVTIGGSTSLAYHLGLPIRNHLVEHAPDGKEKPLGQEKYYVPGSILRVKVGKPQPVAFGMPEDVDVMFDNSPVFDLTAEALQAGAKPILWFDSAEPLRSGWAWGQGYLKDGVAALSYPVGKGTLYMFGPEIAFRAQPHGTFKLLFNAIEGS